VNPALPDRLVLYDGVCGFCNAGVQWLLGRDKAGCLRYAPLQGPTAAAMRARFPAIPADIDTIVFIEGGEVHLRSRAAFRIASHLPAPWRWLKGFGLLPVALTDFGYRIVAAVRYRIWGKLDACRIPAASERALFLP
jgi:predicted DCC family thiol-disulfide oxidoreductase YuxK